LAVRCSREWRWMVAAMSSWMIGRQERSRLSHGSLMEPSQLAKKGACKESGIVQKEKQTK